MVSRLGATEACLARLLSDRLGSDASVDPACFSSVRSWLSGRPPAVAPRLSRLCPSCCAEGVDRVVAPSIIASRLADQSSVPRPRPCFRSRSAPSNNERYGRLRRLALDTSLDGRRMPRAIRSVERAGCGDGSARRAGPWISRMLRWGCPHRPMPRRLGLPAAACRRGAGPIRAAGLGSKGGASRRRLDYWRDGSGSTGIVAGRDNGVIEASDPLPRQTKQGDAAAQRLGRDGCRLGGPVARRHDHRVSDPGRPLRQSDTRAFSDHSKSYSAAWTSFRRSSGVHCSMAAPMAFRRSSIVRADVFWSQALILAKAISIGLKPGE